MHPVSLPPCSYSHITLWGAEGQSCLCAHDCAVIWQKQSERWEKERAGGLDADLGEKKRSCKYRKLHTVVSRRQAASQAKEVAANSAERRELKQDYRNDSRTKSSQWKGALLDYGELVALIRLWQRSWHSWPSCYSSVVSTLGVYFGPAVRQRCHLGHVAVPVRENRLHEVGC